MLGPGDFSRIDRDGVRGLGGRILVVGDPVM